MEEQKDRNLDIPAEANREKHINFLDAEERTTSENSADTDRSNGTKEDNERRKQWQQGLEEGKRAANENND